MSERVGGIIKRSKGPRHPLTMRFKTLGAVRMAAKRALQNISKAVWRVPLDRERTIKMIKGYEIHVTQDDVVHFPDTEPIVGDRPPTFGGYEIPNEPEYVWRLQRDERIRSMRITSSGTILLNNKYLLDMDFGSVAGVADRPWKRRRVEVDTAIVPWSHKWATYYEFVMHTLSKLCRIKETIDPSTWETAKVCYPLGQSRYARQYLSLLGVGEDARIDTQTNVEIVARSIVISNLQNIGSRLPSPTGLAALRRAFLGGDAPRTPGKGRGLYLSRARPPLRHVLNEPEVRRVVSSHGLEIVERIPESVTEQIRMFSDAPLIVSPHGSGLTNIVWCAPGTRVIELFSRSFAPPMYAYISHVLGLRHNYLVDDAEETHHWTNMHKDMVVDVRSLERALEGS